MAKEIKPIWTINTSIASVRKYKSRHVNQKKFTKMPGHLIFFEASGMELSYEEDDDVNSAKHPHYCVLFATSHKNAVYKKLGGKNKQSSVAKAAQRGKEQDEKER